MKIHPVVIDLRRRQSEAETSCRDARAGCAPQPRAWAVACDPGLSAAEAEGGFGAGMFGVKRPLRFLAFKLKLTDAQVAELAVILDELKTERAQAAVDDRRSLSAFAEAVSAGTFDETKAAGAAAQRRKSAEALGQAVVKALGRIHTLLTPEQRERFAYLIRTGNILV